MSSHEQDQFFNWEPSRFGLDIKKMDDEHRLLIALMNQLEMFVRKGGERYQIKSALTKFSNVAKAHFKAEEDFMRQISYPGFENHAEQHALLLERLDEFSVVFITGPGILPREFLIFIRDWLVVHISREDRAYANYFFLPKEI